MNGFSGYTPPHYGALQEGLKELDPGVMAALRQFGPFLVYVHADKDTDHRYKQFMEAIPDVRRLGESDAGALYEVPPRPAASHGTDAPLVIASTRVKDNQFVISFDQSVHISSIEFDFGEHWDHRPPAIRISVADDGRDQAVVWEGSAAGPAMLASLSDRVRMPLTFDLPHCLNSMEASAP